MTALEKAKDLIFFDAEPNLGQLQLLERIKDLMASRLLARLPGDVTVVPKELEYIHVELIVRRFNRIGSEGMKTESLEGHSATYDDGLSDFQEDIVAWIHAHQEQTLGVVRFL